MESSVLIVFLGFGVAANICSASNSDKISRPRQVNNKKTGKLVSERYRPRMLDYFNHAKEEYKKFNEEQQKKPTPKNGNEAYAPDPKKEQEERLQEYKDLNAMETLADWSEEK